jgi:hypothetical protein
MSWMASKWTDKARVCIVCGGAIGVGEPRMYDFQNKKDAHPTCVPTPPTPPPITPASSSPGGQSDAVKGRQENMFSAELTRNAIDRLTKAIEASTVCHQARNDILKKEVGE